MTDYYRPVLLGATNDRKDLTMIDGNYPMGCGLTLDDWLDYWSDHSESMRAGDNLTIKDYLDDIRQARQCIAELLDERDQLCYQLEKRTRKDSIPLLTSLDSVTLTDLNGLGEFEYGGHFWILAADARGYVLTRDGVMGKRYRARTGATDEVKKDIEEGCL